MPKGVYFKHGAFYKVVKGRWYRLGHSIRALDAADFVTLPTQMSDYKAEVLKYAYRVLARAKQNAKGRGGGIEFHLSRNCVHRMLNEAGWRCSVTGIPFTLEVVNGKRPYAPSIDRKDSLVGYLPDNCRVVCVAVNFAMNVWGEDVLWRLFSRRRSEVLDASNTILEKQENPLENQ